jgi:hypothetical protein
VPTTQQSAQNKNLDRHGREALHTLIGEQVLNTLGEPPDLLKVLVRPLWENNYRVNVLTGKDIASARIANSFFLAVDADGTIRTCSPEITKQYESR